MPFPFVLPIKNNVSRPVGQVMLSGAAIAASVYFCELFFGGNALLTTDTKSPNFMAEVRQPANNLVYNGHYQKLNKMSRCWWITLDFRIN